MIVNLSVLALMIGLILALNIVSLLPVFVIKFLIKTRLFRAGSLGYEKYQHTDTSNRTSTRSRYFFRDAENFKTTCTGKINLIVIVICVAVCEALSFALYFLVR
ncbi:MAG: hypothetical protein HYZ14_18305 [Bacteroidetes bacterium]|nr:hypothetical protein [Bacteroidota bacterium]